MHLTPTKVDNTWFTLIKRVLLENSLLKYKQNNLAMFCLNCFVLFKKWVTFYLMWIGNGLIYTQLKPDFMVWMGYKWSYCADHNGDDDNDIYYKKSQLTLFFIHLPRFVKRQAVWTLWISFTDDIWSIDVSS